MPRIEHFEDLEIWQGAYQLALGIYQMSNMGDFARDFGLRDQIRRAVVSVSSNIAEGFEREGDREFLRFLSIAKGSLAEVRSQLHLAKGLGYLQEEVAESLLGQASVLSRQIGTFMAYLNRSLSHPVKQSRNRSSSHPISRSKD